MKLSDCFDEIKKIYFNSERTDALNKFAFSVLHEIKYNHFYGSDYPRTGWLISFNQENNSLNFVHKEASIPLLNHLERSLGNNPQQLYLFGRN